jgi:hypothetical protein
VYVTGAGVWYTTPGLADAGDSFTGVWGARREVRGGNTLASLLFPHSSQLHLAVHPLPFVREGFAYIGGDNKL